MDRVDTDRDVLQHLLAVEANALTLVNDAQTEGDRRIAEAEKQNRARYDEQYGAEAAALDGQYEQERAVIQGEYDRELETYRQSLDAMKTDSVSFNRLLDRLLGKEQ
jgi:regulator of protease activity HflC (stomatin/prohibitin superfamily)